MKQIRKLVQISDKGWNILLFYLQPMFRKKENVRNECISIHCHNQIYITPYCELKNKTQNIVIIFISDTYILLFSGRLFLISMRFLANITRLYFCININSVRIPVLQIGLLYTIIQITQFFNSYHEYFCKLLMLQ